MEMVTMESGGRRRSPPALPGLASAPREAALDDRGFAVEGLAEFWAAAAAAAKVAKFCNCRALIPGERSQRGWSQRWGERLGLLAGPVLHKTT